jgi:subtilisin family serine protease
LHPSRLRAYVATAVVLASAVVAGPAAKHAEAQVPPSDYLVVATLGTSPDKIQQVVADGGGTVLRHNRATGILTVRSSRVRFDEHLRRDPAVAAAGLSRSIGRLVQPRENDDARPVRGYQGSTVYSAAPSDIDPVPEPRPEPLEHLQWDLAAVDAGYLGSHAIHQGSPGVTVGVMDSGIDISHPDLTANVLPSRSRNLLLPGTAGHDANPTIDGTGHGTQVAGHIAAAINGLGVSGVAPKTRLASLRVVTDDNYIFVQPVVDALTYAVEQGVDIVNMSFGLDPWLFACPDNPADFPEQQAEQRATVVAMQRALDYARSHGVLAVAAEGNGNNITRRGINLDNPTVDNDSPTFPLDSAHPRAIDNSCLLLPAEGNHVVAVAGTGPSGRKGYYSNYGIQETDVAAPGGDFHDNPTNTRDVTYGTLSTASEAALRRQGLIDANGNPTSPAILHNCKLNGSPCAYYRYSDGTSLATPIASGVAAILAARYGIADPQRRGELNIDPGDIEQRLYATATPRPCPPGGSYTYTLNLPNGTTEVLTHQCEGDIARNGFYGHGLVNARNAARI